MKKNYKYLDQLFEPILIINKKKDIVYYNHYFSTFSGLSPRKIKKVTSISNLISSIDGKIDLDSQVLQINKDGGSSVSKEGLIHFSGSSENYNCVIRVNLISEDEILICINDLSIEKSIYDKYRKQVEELKVSYKQLVLADKLKSIGELSTGISHEISNPLTIASGNTEILEILLESQENLSSRENIFESISNIQSSLLRINKITLNMKKFVHQGSSSKQFVSVNKIIESSIDLVLPSFSRQEVELRHEIDSNISAYVDELAIEQVLVNLLKNALDAVLQSNKKEKVVIIKTVVSKNNDSFSILVQDTGDGIQLDNVDKVFNPFFTTKILGEGTGMGLSLSTQIIEDHQGKLVLHENTEKGCVFSLNLPSAEISIFLDLENKKSNLEDNENIKVLIIDKDYNNLNFFISLNESVEGYFLVSDNITKSLQLLKSTHVDKVIFSSSMYSKDILDSILEVNGDFELYICGESDGIAEAGIKGIIDLPLNKEDVLDKLNIRIGEGHES